METTQHRQQTKRKHILHPSFGDTFRPNIGHPHCTGDGDTSFLLLFHPIHSGLSFMNFTNLLLTTRVVQNAFLRIFLVGGWIGIFPK